MSMEDPVKRDIRRLDAIRRETRYWTLGSFIAIIAMLAVELAVVVGGVHNLFTPGPVQNQFSASLVSDMNSDVLPIVQTTTSQALTQSQPAMEAQFKSMSKRLPDVSNAFMKQFTQLQRDLPQQGNQIVQATFGETLKAQDPKIRQMFPDATDQNVNALIDSVTAESQDQITTASQSLFSQHVAALNSINADLSKIESTEPVAPNQDQANLQMAVSVVGAFSSDLGSANASGASTTSTSSPSALSKKSQEKKQ